MLLEFLLDYGMFFAKVATFVVAAFLIIGAIVSATQQEKSPEPGQLKISKLNDRLKSMESGIRDASTEAHTRKAQIEAERKEDKNRNKQAKKTAKKHQSSEDSEQAEKQVYVLDFNGDVRASAVERLRQEISGVLTLATDKDEIVVRLESPGGMVHAYGLAASQLERIKSAGIPLTICVDKVAASGGYMMACIADKIMAAPFAVLGSIGVVASLPNFNRVLKKNDIDYELLTAGEYKRTLTMLGENTEEGRKKFLKDLEETHVLFKDFVADYRPQLDIAVVATGETWYGKRALENQLIDEISTSDAYINGLTKEHSVYLVSYEEKKNWQDKLGLAAESAIEKSLDKLLLRSQQEWQNRH